jgi:hypothetical protein
MGQDHITVSEVDFGEDFPVLSNARVRPSDEKGRVVSGPPLIWQGRCGLQVSTENRGRRRLLGSRRSRDRHESVRQLS